jgi:hypothetical protein
MTTISTHLPNSLAAAAPRVAVAPPPPPTVSVKNATIDEKQSISASSLIGSIVNPAGMRTTQYAFMDQGAGGGRLTLNGVALSSGVMHYLTAAQLGQLSYVGGANPGADQVTIKSYDGSAWSTAKTATVTVAPPPTVNVNNASISAGQTIAGSSLIASVTDPAGNAITQYAFMNTGADGGKLLLNGNAVAAGAWVNVAASQLSQLSYVGGTTTGTDSVSIKAYDGHIWSGVSNATISQTAAPPPPPPTPPPTPTGVLSQLSDPGIRTDVANLMVNNSLSYNSMLTILQDAAAGGMTSSKFSTLQTLASLLNVSGGISTSTYVQDITDSVVNGDPANATWTGGSSTPVALGNLSATSSQATVNELIGKWFPGTDLPNIDVSTIGESNFGSTYQASANSLYGPGGNPSYLDVNQGYVGDCYFMASLGDVALQNPNSIQSMITNNGNGTYGVRFDVNGKDTYVTVNNQLPTLPSGYSYANGSNLEFANGSVAWPELIEKAYAQLNEEPNAPHGDTLNAAVDSYAGIDSGSAYALTEITGQSVNAYALSASTSSGTLAADNSQLGAAFSSGEELLVGTSNNVTGNLVPDHMFEVIGYNAANQTLTLHNPWGSGYSGSLPMTFTESLSALAANNSWLYSTNGSPTA